MASQSGATTPAASTENESVGLMPTLAAERRAAVLWAVLECSTGV